MPDKQQGLPVKLRQQRILVKVSNGCLIKQQGFPVKIQQQGLPVKLRQQGMPVELRQQGIPAGCQLTQKGMPDKAIGVASYVKATKDTQGFPDKFTS